MAQIPRPPKQGNVTTYVAKVAAGYKRILAGEVDADFDTIFGAWNAGADTVNIRDGAVTSAKLAADSVGPREMQDGGIGTANLGDASVTTPKLADGSVTDPKIVSVSWAKVTGPPASLPPNGAAGGDLSGTYPNPAIRDGAVTAAKMAPGTVTGATLVDGAVTTPKIADGAVTHAKLAPGALPGNSTVQPIPPGFATTTLATWIPVQSLLIETRGANPVFLFANHCLQGASSVGPGQITIRWMRNPGGVHLCNQGYTPNGVATYPVPLLPWCDIVPAAGVYAYELQVFLGFGMTAVNYVVAGNGGNIAAFELG